METPRVVVNARARLGEGRLILGLRHRLAWLDTRTGAVAPFLEFERRAHIRCNDGKSDASGRFWFGSMSTAGPEASLYRYDPDGSLHIMETGLTVSNGLGCLWSAMWDGWCVVRFDPAGRELGRLLLPVQRPTCCAFGGPDLATLYITTAAVGLSEDEIERSLHAGDLFAVHAPVTGFAANRVSA